MTSTVDYFSSTDYNVTTPDPALHWRQKLSTMRKVWTPFILVFGIVGNILTLLLMRRIRKHSTSYVFFMVLAVSDLITLCIGLFPRWIQWQFGFSLKDESPFFCVFLKWAGYSAGTSSAYFLVAVTVYRALAAVLPHRMRGTRQGKCVMVTNIAGVAGSILHNVYVPFYMDYSASKCKFTGSFYEDALPVLSWFNAMVYCFLPSTIIIVSNVLLIRALTASSRKTKSEGACESAKGRENERRNIMLVVVTVSICFLVLTLPTSIVRIALNMDPTLKSNAFEFWGEFAKLWWYMNSAVNFYLYICTGKGLRKEARRIFCKSVKALDASRAERFTAYKTRSSLSKSEDEHLSSKSCALVQTSRTCLEETSVSEAASAGHVSVQRIPAELTHSASPTHVDETQPSQCTNDATGTVANTNTAMTRY